MADKEKKGFQSQGELVLSKPLLVDGKELKTLEYDFDALTAEDIMDVDKTRRGDDDSTAIFPQIDMRTQLYMFARAVNKKMNNVEPTDIKRLGGRDALKAMGLGRGFMLVLDVEGDEDEEETKAQTENVED